MGDAEAAYTYSGARFEPHPWPATLRELRRRLADELGCDDVERASDAAFELVASTLDHELLYGRLTRTSPRTDGELIDELTTRCLDLLGISSVAHASTPEAVAS